MKFDVESSNPMLVGAMQLMKAEDTPEHRKLITDELAKAVFLSPVYVDPAPVTDEEGNVKVEPGAKVQFPMLNTKDGKRFFVLYTDKRCMDEAEDAEGNATPEIFRDHFAAVQLDELGAMMAATPEQMQPAAADGVVINPFHENFVVGKEMAIGLFRHKVEVLKKKAENARRSMEDPGKVIRFPGSGRNNPKD